MWYPAVPQLGAPTYGETTGKGGSLGLRSRTGLAWREPDRYLSILKRDVSLCCATKCLKTASAMGLRQMLPGGPHRADRARRICFVSAATHAADFAMQGSLDVPRHTKRTRKMAWLSSPITPF